MIFDCWWWHLPIWQQFNKSLKHDKCGVFQLLLIQQPEVNELIFFNKYSSGALSSHLGHFGLSFSRFRETIPILKYSYFFCSRVYLLLPVVSFIGESRQQHNTNCGPIDQIYTMKSAALISH